MPSAANASRRSAERLASLTFFLDHQIGRYIVADKLREAGAAVEVHLDHFKGDAPDLEWIPEIGRRDWILITKDQNIRRTHNRPGSLLFAISRTGVFSKLI